MNRRGFLSLIAPAAALIVAPELFIPKRTFFLPPAGGWTHYHPGYLDQLAGEFARHFDANVWMYANEMWNGHIYRSNGTLLSLES